ncbi:hypothetical protein JCM10213_000073 [Rhodosporidiobolus nylandii]
MSHTTFRSFLSILLLSFFLPSLSLCSANPHPHPPPSLFPSSHLSHAPLHPRPSLKQLLKSRQARAPPTAAFTAAHRAMQARVVEVQLRGLRGGVEEVREEVGRVAERARRAVGGAGWGRRSEGVGEEMHDLLYNLLNLVADTRSPPPSSSPAALGCTPTSADVDVDVTVGMNLAARPAAVSASPLPSGRAAMAKRSLTMQQPETPSEAPLQLLSSTLSTLQLTLSTASSVLPYLPIPQQRAIEALVEELQGEADGLAEGVLNRLEMGWVVQGRVARSAQLLATLGAGGTDDFAAV